MANGFCKKEYEASLTLEASVVLPLYMLALIAIISLMEMIKCYQDVEMNLYKSAKELALYAAGTDVIEDMDDSIVKNIALTILADSYTEDAMKKQLVQDKQAIDVMVNGKDGISFLQSYVCFEGNSSGGKGDIIDLVADYQMGPLCNIFGVAPYKVVNRCRVHAWTGFEGSGGNHEDFERIVYITDSGNVYHLSRSCTHISLSIQVTDVNNVANCRNSNGGKYKECEKCGKDISASGILFITSDGEKYHSSLSCSGLKRTVTAIPLSEVGERGACSRCIGG